jgi:uncharacterized protein YlxW (UPF0749 family)
MNLWALAITLATPTIALTIAVTKVIWKLSDISTKVDLILTNHLPHINGDIRELRQEILDIHDKL